MSNIKFRAGRPFWATLVAAVIFTFASGFAWFYAFDGHASDWRYFDQLGENLLIVATVFVILALVNLLVDWAVYQRRVRQRIRDRLNRPNRFVDFA